VTRRAGRRRRTPSALVRVGSAVPSGPGQRRFVSLVLIDAIGTGMFLPVTVLFFTQSARLSAVDVGAGLSISAVAGLLATPAAGRLLDRYDTLWVLFGTFVLRAGCYSLYSEVHSFATFLPLVCIAGAASQAGRPARTMLAAQIAPADGRVHLGAFIAVSRNVGFGLGGLLAGVALAADSRAGYLSVLWLNVVSYLVGAALLPGFTGRHPAERRPRDSPRGRLVARDRPYLALAGLNSVVMLHESVFLVGIPTWLARTSIAPLALLGILSTLNTVLVVLLQLPVSKNANSVSGGARAYGLSGIAFGAACLLFAATDPSYPVISGALLTAGAIILTGAEMFSVAGEWAVSTGLAPRRDRGLYLSTYSMGFSLQKIFGPAVVSVVVVKGGRLGWLLLGLVVAIAATASALIARRADTATPDTVTPAGAAPAGADDGADETDPPGPEAGSALGEPLVPVLENAETAALRPVDEVQ
jgi:MFS family permease